MSRADLGSPETTSGAGSRIVGSKGGAGVAERIVSELPTHTLYIEAFAELASVGRLKRRSSLAIYIEQDLPTATELLALLDPLARLIEPGRRLGPLAKYSRWAERTEIPELVLCGNVLSLDPSTVPAEAVMYCDPPYLSSTRRSPRRYYRCELAQQSEHERFLGWALKLPCRVLISGYASGLYDQKLAHWRRLDFGTATRGGRAIESLWCNFAPSIELHDSRFVGAGFRERERIRRKARRWAKKFSNLPPSERAAILAALQALPVKANER